MSLMRELLEARKTTDIDEINAIISENRNSTNLSDKGICSLTDLDFKKRSYSKLNLSNNYLKDLKGCPDVKGELDLSENELTSLKGLPANILCDIYVNQNPSLTSLEGLPKYLHSLSANRTKIKNLKGAPDNLAGYLSAFNCQLTSLEGAPREVGIEFGGDCDFSDNPLTSLKGAPLIVQGSFFFTNTKVTSLQGIGQEYLKVIYDSIAFDLNKIRSHALGLLLVKGLQRIDYSKPSMKNIGFYIINKWIHKAKNDNSSSAEEYLIDCQHELIEAGFDDLAQL